MNYLLLIGIIGLIFILGKIGSLKLAEITGQKLGDAFHLPPYSLPGDFEDL